ncbi:MAG: hypothetical protein K6B40_05210 [Firmicutes bacterium]|nr:hypothetical protein [Bacillota bacterium]
MKKMVWIVLCILLLVSMCALCACASDAGTGDEDAAGSDAQQTGDADAVSEEAGSTAPDGTEKATYDIAEGSIAQSDYYLDDNHYVVRVAKGQQENLSGVSADETFSDDETVQVCGLDTRLRYNTDKVGDTETTYGIADAYDAETDTCYCVFMVKNGQKDLLMQAMEKLITGETKIDTQNGDSGAAAETGGSAQ